MIIPVHHLNPTNQDLSRTYTHKSQIHDLASCYVSLILFLDMHNNQKLNCTASSFLPKINATKQPQSLSHGPHLVVHGMGNARFPGVSFFIFRNPNPRNIALQSSV